MIRTYLTVSKFMKAGRISLEVLLKTTSRPSSGGREDGVRMQYPIVAR